MFKVKFEKSKDLLKVVSTIDNIVRQNKMTNELKFIKLENDKNRLKLTARNTFMTFEYYVSDVIEISGEPLLYDSKTLLALLNVLDGEIDIEDKIIKNPRCKYKVPITTAENYPSDVIPDITNYIEFDTEEFKQAIDNVVAACDNKEGILSGVYLDVNKLVACDQKRIFMNNIEKTGEIDSLTISKDLINEVAKLPFGEKTKLAIFGQHIIFFDNNIKIACNIMTGKYPKYEAILPKQIEYEIEINKQDFEYALNLILPVIDEETGQCILVLENDRMQIQAKTDLNEADTSIKIKCNKEITEPKKMKFNIRFLIEMLKANGNNVLVTTYTDNIGVMFQSMGAKQYIMPIVN